MFDNRLDYLPEAVFNQLDSLEYLYVQPGVLQQQ